MTGGAPAADSLLPSREKVSADGGRMRGSLELANNVIALADVEASSPT